jgi:hypothetical protein
VARTTHDRTLDHRGTELDTDVLLSGGLPLTADGSTVHQALLDLNALSTTDTRDGGVQVIIGGGASPITTGIKADIELPFAGQITANRLFADQAGDIVVDIWKDSYANFPPVVGDSITASAKPTLSAAAKSQDTTLTGWTTTFAEGDVLRVNVDSAATVTRVTLALRISRASSIPVSVGVAAGTGAAGEASINIAPNAGVGSGTGAAYNATVTT